MGEYMGTLALTTFLPSLTMLVPKQHRHDVYKYLFKEGVMVAKKDFNKKSHDDPELDVPNLHVIKLMQSLKSRGCVKTIALLAAPAFSCPYTRLKMFQRCFSLAAGCGIFLLSSTYLLLVHLLFLRYVNERFSWNWYYYYLTNEGIDYLQKFLNLPADVVP